MNIADEFLNLNQEQANKALIQMSDIQKTHLKNMLSKRQTNINTTISKVKATPYVTENGEPLKDYLSDELPTEEKEYFGLFLQLGAGMSDTIDDLGRLLGAELSEDKRPREPKTKIQEATRFAGSFFSPQLPGLGIAVKSAMNAMKAPAAVAKMQRVRNLLKPIAEQTGKGYAFAAEMLSSIPRESIERALKNPDKLNKPFNMNRTYRSIGQRAQKAINHLTKEAGEAVKRESDSFTKPIPGAPVDLIDASPYAYAFQDMVNDTIKGRIETISPSGTRIVKRIQNQLVDIATDPTMKGKTTAAELHGLKKQIDTLVSYNSETVQKLGDSGAALLKKLRHKINTDLRVKYPQYAEANDNFTQLSKLKENVINRLKDKSLSKNMRIVANQADDTEMRLLKELDEMSPKGLKFYDKLQDAKMLQAMDELFPGRGGGSGSAQGIGNLLRAGFGIQTGGMSLLLSSPAGQKQLIKTTSKARRKLIKFGATPKRIAPISLIKSGSALQESLED